MQTPTTIGILAHVDAGKTTLSESILYLTGAIRKRGRVDHQDAFLDTDAMEKKRGITIFSKLARFSRDGRPFILLDTPGHADFSPETERALRVLDAAVLVLSAADVEESGITDPQAAVLWRLLAHNRVPTFLFVNKMDQLRTEDPKENEKTRQSLFAVIRKELGEGLVPFDGDQLSTKNEEQVAVLDEKLTEKVLEGEHLTAQDVTSLIQKRKLFPVYFGAALQDEGVSDLLEGLARFTQPGQYPAAFGARVYKVTREGTGPSAPRLVWMKLTGGTLSVRDAVEEKTPLLDAGAENADGTEDVPDRIFEKISGIRLYSGEKYTSVTSAQAGEIVCVTGLSRAQAGDGLGFEENRREELLSPIETRAVIPPKGVDRFTLLQALRGLEEEEPMLHVAPDEKTGDICVQIMGQIQTEILQHLLEENYGIRATFGPGRIVYKETIRRPVEGVGHFEPLRHYAEVHVLLSPGEPGSGVVIENGCLPNMLDSNWQNLILQNLAQKTHKGVLTGSDLTDVKITLLGGKASKKHTEGGDFRKAALRAVRQGLMCAENILLEPVLSFHLELPKENLGRALNDLSQMSAKLSPASFSGDTAVLEGKVPASTLGSYAAEAAGYTGGRAKLSVSLSGYEPCHNSREVLDAAGYNPDEDRYNPSYSVFCSHGAGTIVTWDHVRSHMQVDTGWRSEPEDPSAHYLSDDYYTFTAEQEDDTPVLDDGLAEDSEKESHDAARKKKGGDFRDREAAYQAAEKELVEIFEKTYGKIPQRLKNPENERLDLLEPQEEEKGPGDPKYAAKKEEKRRPLAEYLLVDGYNIIYAWSELRDLAATDIKAARDKLIDILCDYAGISGFSVILVFDAYRVPGGAREVTRQGGIDIVYTKEAETADLYIEKTAHSLSQKHRVYVATSDAIEQVIIYGAGAYRLSARGLLEQILAAKERMRQEYSTD
ncbi:MAG: NYN domain-containing protein [Lachnospiraceae bacterium]